MRTETDDDDPFDLSKMALDADLIAELTPFQKTTAAKPKRRSRAKTKFVTLPYEQTLAAAGQAKCAPLAVLVELAHQVFKNHRTKVTLSNSVLRSVGVSQWAKNRALRQLEAAGMVAVDWEGGKAPRVTILWEAKFGAKPW
jgi:hypothetical protein